jgi:TPP-dependent pyruvate/acetoin dehydrogenase alpha subunit
MELSKEQLVEMYYYMRLGRAVEDRLETMYKQGRVPGAIYLGHGQEACYVGSSYALEKGDVLAPTHRDMIAMLPRGMEIKPIIAQHLGKATGPTHGRGEATYLGDLKKGIFTTVSMLPDFYPVATGAALAFKYRDEPRVALAYCGEGATARGDWHEALNFAAVQNLPVVFFVINNRYAYSTPTEKEMKVPNVADRAPAYGMPGHVVDGNDVLAVYEVAKEAIDRARSGGGPSLIEGKTMRMRGHAGHDPFDYVPPTELKEWEARDPIIRFEKYLIDRDHLDDTRRQELFDEINGIIDEAVEYAEQSPLPEPSEVSEGVYH